VAKAMPPLDFFLKSDRFCLVPLYRCASVEVFSIVQSLHGIGIC
jgi:hypothetical protein